MMNKKINYIKQLLLGNAICMNCSHARSIYLLSDMMLRCDKNKTKNSMNYTCEVFKKTKEDDIKERWYYYNKYIEDRRFFAMIKRTTALIKEYRNG